MSKNGWTVSTGLDPDAEETPGVDPPAPAMTIEILVFGPGRGDVEVRVGNNDEVARAKALSRSRMWEAARAGLADAQQLLSQ